jgi:hypothetical protein
MNRYNREERRKYNVARKGLSKEELQALDLEEEREKQIADLAHRMHVKLYPEEYDCMFDRFVEARDRRRGVNPMSKEYIEKVNEKRIKEGVSPLAENGIPMDPTETKLLCLEEARKQIASEKTAKKI